MHDLASIDRLILAPKLVLRYSAPQASSCPRFLDGTKNNCVMMEDKSHLFPVSLVDFKSLLSWIDLV